MTVDENKELENVEDKEEKEVSDSSAEDVKTEDKDTPDSIPYDRFKEVNDKKKELEKQLEELPDIDKFKNEFKEKEKQLIVKEKAIENGVRKEALDDFVRVADLSTIEENEEGYLGVNELIKNMKENKGYFFNEPVNKVGNDFKGDGEDVGNDDSVIKKIMKL